MPKEDTQFKEGNPGGPGRPLGSRNKLSEAFIAALNTTFSEAIEKTGTEAGLQSLRELRDKQPAQYNNVIAKLMPKLMELTGPDGGAIPLEAKVTFVSKGD